MVPLIEFEQQSCQHCFLNLEKKNRPEPSSSKTIYSVVANRSSSKQPGKFSSFFRNIIFLYRRIFSKHSKMAFKKTAILVLCLMVLVSSLALASPSNMNIGGSRHGENLTDDIDSMPEMAYLKKGVRDGDDTSNSAQISGSIFVCSAVGLTILSV